MPIQKLEKELKSLQKDIDEAIKKSDSRKQNHYKDTNIKQAVSKVRVIMEEIHLNYSREQRDKDIEKKAFLNLIRAVGFFDLNLSEIERLLKAFLRQERLDRREAAIDLRNSLTHLNYVNESINKIIINADALMNTLSSRDTKSRLIMSHLPATHEHFSQLAKEAEKALSQFEKRNDVTSDVEKILSWIMHYRKKEISTSYKEKKAFFALLRQVDKYDKSLERAHNELSNFVVHAGIDKRAERKMLKSAGSSLSTTQKTILEILKSTKNLVFLIKKEEKSI